MRRWSGWRSAVAVAAGAWIAAGTAAGETPRPRLGLALSGGGARGLAHVGVLRYLEDHCIPVDAVAGTSMGGLLGGLYAMGYEAEELRGLVAGIDWDQLSRTGPPYRDQSYRRKEDARHLAGGVELGLRDGLTLPSGLSAGPEITFLLDRLALPYGGIGDFDRLPTPLRVTATDLLDAVPVTLGEGSLPEAMRATLSIPGVFTPVERDGRLLVDGGVLENLPVEVARWMGSDRVLAVDAGTPLLKREELGSVLSMLDQTFGVMMMESIRRNRAAADVLLVPDLGRYSNQSFRKLEALDALGYQAASLQADQLAPYAVDETAWQDWREARARRRLLATPLPERLRVVGVEGREAASLSGRLSGLTGAGFTVEGLEAELRRILGEGRYERLSYEVEAEAGGGTLVVRAERKRHGPPFLKLGLELSNARPDTLNATIGARLTVLDLGASGSEWRTDVALGARGELRSEIYRPLAGGRIFVSPRAYLEDRDQDLYGEDERQAIWATRRTGAGGDLGLALGHNAELRVGFDLRQLSSHLSAGPPGQATPEGAEAVVGARFGLDRSDAPVIPGRGLRAAAAEWWIDSPGLAGDRLRLEGSLGPALKLGRRSSVLLHASGGAGVGGDLPLELDFTLGGPLRLSAYGLDQFRGDNYLLFNAGLLRQVATLPLLFNGRVYGLGLLEAGSAFDRSPAEAHYRTCLTAALLAETRLAMLTFGVSFAHDRSANWIFALGPRF